MYRTIIIYGMRGVGKTTIASALAKKIGYTHVDLDEEIEKIIKEPLVGYIDRVGRDAFRDIEHRVLYEVIMKKGNQVLSLGGGTIMTEKNQTIITKYNELLIYLSAPVDIIIQRIQNDENNDKKRNSLTGHNITKDVEIIYKQRKDVYEYFADITIDASKSMDVIIDEIIPLMKIGNMAISCLDLSPNGIKSLYATIDPSIKYIELRLDYIDRSLYHDVADLVVYITNIVSLSPRRIILTSRTALEGGHDIFTRKEIEYICQHLIILTDCLFDIELSRLHDNNALVSYLPMQLGSIIISYHNIYETPDFTILTHIVDTMYGYGEVVAKIACMVQKMCDVVLLYALQEYCQKYYPDKNYIIIGMGKLGKKTRYIIPHQGGLLTFVSRDDRHSAPGQYNRHEMKQLLYTKGYKKNSKRTIMLIGGDQIVTSLSPRIHNLAAYIGQVTDFSYLPACPTLPKDLETTIDMIAASSSLIGANVTMPYKLLVYTYMRQKYMLDETALLTQAVNTIVKQGSTLIGYNTDIDGIVDSMRQTLESFPDHAIIIGSGGASMAAILACIYLNMSRITVIARNKDRLCDIIAHFDYPIDTICYDGSQNNDIVNKLFTSEHVIINATPVDLPINLAILNQMQCKLYFSMLYNNQNKQKKSLTSWCDDHHIPIIDGRKMLLYQAKRGFELWNPGTVFNTEIISLLF